MNRLLPAAAVLMAILMASCANEKAITGGPEDTEAPVVIASQPRMGALNVDPELRIELRFSEQMVRESVEGAIQFWPSPPAGYEIETSWRWARQGACLYA